VDANRDADRWGALADGTRLAIVARLAEGPLAVGKLAAGLPVTRSAVSQHLKIKPPEHNLLGTPIAETVFDAPPW
jgi:DNA-binding transcriptional ArsR family regulator